MVMRFGASLKRDRYANRSRCVVQASFRRLANSIIQGSFEMAKQSSGPPDDETKKGDKTKPGEAYDPFAEPDESVEEAPPQSIGIGSPIDEDQYRNLKRQAERQRAHRNIQPQTDDATPGDESTSESEHD